MHEYVTVSSSSYDPASLAAKLTEKSAEGWTVVAIVPTGGDVTAFLSREGDAASADTSLPGEVPADAAAPTPTATEEATADETSTTDAAAAMAPGAAIAAEAAESEPVAASEPVSEPAGWAVAPEQTSEPTPEPMATSSAPETVGASAGATDAAAASAPTQAAAPTPSVPAGWYADPAGRFELRYWDGNTWTEHVSRGGQQYTDAPVA